MKIFYAVFVLYLILRENKSSVVKISNILMAVVATSFIRKIYLYRWTYQSNGAVRCLFQRLTKRNVVCFGRSGPDESSHTDPFYITWNQSFSFLPSSFRSGRCYVDFFSFYNAPWIMKNTFSISQTSCTTLKLSMTTRQTMATRRSPIVSPALQNTTPVHQSYPSMTTTVIPNILHII